MGSGDLGSILAIAKCFSVLRLKVFWEKLRTCRCKIVCCQCTRTERLIASAVLPGVMTSMEWKRSSLPNINQSLPISYALGRLHFRRPVWSAPLAHGGPSISTELTVCFVFRSERSLRPEEAQPPGPEAETEASWASPAPVRPSAGSAAREAVPLDRLRSQPKPGDPFWIFLTSLNCLS